MEQSFRAEAADKPFPEQLLSAINSVHSVQGITAVPIDRKLLPNGWTGQFDPYTRTVTVSPEAPFPLATGVHEIGHAVDAMFLVTASKLGRLDGPISLYASQYAVQGRGLLVDWYQEIQRSRPILELRQAASSARFMSDPWNEAQYWLDPLEIWARAYEQFIAENTGDEEFKSQFQQKRLQEATLGGQRFRV